MKKSHKLFAQEYVIDFNATAAYKRAGYKAKGNSAEANASRLLSNDKVKDYISQLQDEIADRNKISVDFVVNGIRDIALDGEQENNRLKAYELLGKYTGAFEKDNKQQNKSQIIYFTEMPEEDKDVKYHEIKSEEEAPE